MASLTLPNGKLVEATTPGELYFVSTTLLLTPWKDRSHACICQSISSFNPH